MICWRYVETQARIFANFASSNNGLLHLAPTPFLTDFQSPTMWSCSVVCASMGLSVLNVRLNVCVLCLMGLGVSKINGILPWDRDSLMSDLASSSSENVAYCDFVKLYVDVDRDLYQQQQASWYVVCLTESHSVRKCVICPTGPQWVNCVLHASLATVFENLWYSILSSESASVFSTLNSLELREAKWRHRQISMFAPSHCLNRW